ncbi:hypothetical protein H1R20_g12905, partial [Candolleomyces eurysporus]
MSRQTVQRPGPRLHRLPRRLDYMLIPAPLDLSLDSMTEKSPLPAIIVTPSSPTHSKDFAIAFLAPPTDGLPQPDPSSRETMLLSRTVAYLFDVVEGSPILFVPQEPPGIPLHPSARTPQPTQTTSQLSPSHPLATTSTLLLHPATVSSSINKLLLLTGFTDGLLNVSDAYEEDEDEAVILTANWGCSIAQAGWVGEKGEGVWAGSDMETFSTWSSELDPILDFDIREPGVHGGDVQWVTDYLVGCHSPSTSIPKLSVFVGSNEGDVALISTPHPLTKPTPRNRQPASSSWYLQTAWTHQHVGVVRALYYDQRHQLVVTGGEDAKLHVWRDSTGGALYEGDDDVDMDVDDAAPTDDEELARRRVKSSRKRESVSDDEDEAMPDRTSYHDGLRATYTAWISARGFWA